MMDGEDGGDVSVHMARQIDENLKRAFGAGAAGPVPDRFLNLIEKLRTEGVANPPAAEAEHRNMAGARR